MQKGKININFNEVVERVIALRGGINQKKFSKELGFSQGLLSHIETGRRKPTIKFLLQLASVAGVTVDYILTGTKEHSLSPRKTKESLKEIIKNLEALHKKL